MLESENYESEESDNEVDATDGYTTTEDRTIVNGGESNNHSRVGSPVNFFQTYDIGNKVGKLVEVKSFSAGCC